MRTHFIFAVLLLAGHLQAQQLVLHPSTHAAGVEVILLSGYDPDYSSHCLIEYKAITDTDWKSGFEADRVTISGAEYFKGSLLLSFLRRSSPRTMSLQCSQQVV